MNHTSKRFNTVKYVKMDQSKLLLKTRYKWKKILENEESYKDLQFIVSKVNFYSSQHTPLFSSNPVVSLIPRINYVALMN